MVVHDMQRVENPGSFMLSAMMLDKAVQCRIGTNTKDTSVQTVCFALF